MTSALAADSYFRALEVGRDRSEADPEGRQSVIKLIDLVVNSEACFLAIRAGADYSRLPSIANSLPLIRKENADAFELRDEADRRLFAEFLILLSDSRLGDWWRSQADSPIVTQYHAERRATDAKILTTISAPGWDAWNRLGGRQHVSARLTNFVPTSREATQDIAIVGDLAVYQHAYSFDIFRRGWQYAQLASKHDWIYCPHWLRRRALAAASDEWVKRGQETCWSWGRYMVHVIEHGMRRPANVVQVSEWVAGLREADVPRWDRLWADEEAGEIDGRTLRQLIERLYESARRARLPTMPLERLLTSELVLVASEALRVFGAAERLIQFLPAWKVLALIEQMEDSAAESIKDGANCVRQGTFGYPTLMSSAFERRADAPDKPSYLI